MKSRVVIIYTNPSSIVSQERTPYGIKYQCVELARRWYNIVFGYTFASVPNAIDLFQLDYATRRGAKKTVCPFYKWLNNGHGFRMKFGDLLIWANEGYYAPTGHVAIILDYTRSTVLIAEQNGDTATGIRTLQIVKGVIIDKGRIIGGMRLAQSP